MAGFFSTVIGGIIIEILKWLLDVGTKMYTDYLTRQNILDKNQAIEKGMLDAKTEAERQAALNAAAHHLGTGL